MLTLSSYRSYMATALLLTAGTAGGQVLEPTIPSSQAQIDKQLTLIHTAEQEHRTAAEQGVLWAYLALEYHSQTDFLKAENAYNHSLQLLKGIPASRADYAATLDDLAALYLLYGRVDEAESVRKKVLAVREEIGTPTDIGVSEVHLADLAFAKHQYKKAEQLALHGMNQIDATSTSTQVTMLSALITLTYARCLQRHCSDGLLSAQQANALATTHFGVDSTADGFALETLGFAEWKSGAIENGGKDMLHAVKILRTKLMPGDPRLASVLLQYRDYLATTNRRLEAQEMQEEVDRIKGRTGGVCSACTVSVYSLSKTLR